MPPRSTWISQASVPDGPGAGSTAQSISSASEAHRQIVITCDQVQSIDFTDDTSYVVTWKPGYQGATYYLAPIGFYDSQLKLSDGRLLYAGTWGSGVYRSADGGGHWTAANVGLTDLGVCAEEDLFAQRAGEITATGSGIIPVDPGSLSAGDLHATSRPGDGHDYR